jgi:Tfp pilus assembly protein PilF
VRTDGGRLRVTAELVKAADGFQVWSHEFEGDLADVFAVQDEISGMVVEGMKLHLRAGPGEALPQVPSTTNLTAYNDYLLGRYYLASRTEEGMRTAATHLRAATQADPGYAPAWAALAKTIAVSPFYLPVDSAQELGETAERVARHALSLDPDNAEAWAALGAIQMLFRRDWTAAETSFQRAVDAHPNDVDVANLYGDFLYTIGNYTQAMKYEARAAELEPLSAVNQHELALVYGFLGRMDDAITQERLAVQLGPTFRNAWSTLARLFADLGRHDDVRDLLASQADLLGRHNVLLLEARLAQADGDTVLALQRVAQVETLLRESNLPLTYAALAYAQLGQDEDAARLVREAYAAGDPILVSPLYFFLPEDWPQMPLLQAALAQPGLELLYDLRRQNIAAGTGRVLAE